MVLAALPCASARAVDASVAPTNAEPAASVRNCLRSMMNFSSVSGSALCHFSRLRGAGCFAPDVVPGEDGGRAAGMDEDQHVVLGEAAFADMRDHPGGGFAGIDRVEHDALGAPEQAHGLVAGLARDAVAPP